MNIDKTYHPEDIEQKWYQIWENNNYFSPSGSGESFCIMLPPPNVTGSLHMGHGFGFTLIDILIRYQRMCGKNTLWQGGTDHAGIATQMVVERQLAAKGLSRHALGRNEFVKNVWKWKEESGNNITRQLRRLGASIDWSKERFTMDEGLSFAVREVFIQLFNEGLIYRGKRLVNWDPALLTAISDLEVINQEEDGFLWHIRYPLQEGGFVEVATTRPETMLGDMAVAVNPEDERYQHLIGKMVQLPLSNRLIPIIADDYVDPAFGTGCVKITPAHDFNDYAVGKRHQLEPLNIFTPDAHLNDQVPLAYQGMERFSARKKIIADLDNAKLLVKTEKHTLKIPRGDRSNAIIEPYLTYQWYVKSKPLAEPAIAAVKEGQVKFIPDNWSKTYFQWMENIEDWCISRQLWWGHRVPVWYDENGQAYVGHDETDVRKKYQLKSNVILTQDEDVLDTWFSSALWPFSTLGWPAQTKDFKTFFPTQVLVTGFDIIFFWVARMIMMSLKFTGKIPFSQVYITGLIRDADGHKMSKTKGNVLDPIDLIDGISLDELMKKRLYGLMQPNMANKIEKNTTKEFPQGIPSFGCDALRFTYCSMAAYTREIRFDVQRLTGYRNFCNKLWNASRYVLMNVSQEEKKDLLDVTLSLPDRYIKEKLRQTINAVHEALAIYRFDFYAQVLYDFTWNEFCDWYLELSKPILLDPNSDPTLLRGTRKTLIETLETLLRLLHPIIPFITEEIWQRVAPFIHIETKSIMLTHFPQKNDKADLEAETEMNWVKQMIVNIRTIRSEMNVPPSKKISVLLRKGNEQDRHFFNRNKIFLITLAKIETVTWLSEQEKVPEAATALLGNLEIFIPLSDIINKEEEMARLNKEIAKLQKDFEQINTKLANPNFLDKAPKAVVAKEQARLNEIKSALDKLRKNRCA